MYKNISKIKNIHLVHIQYMRLLVLLNFLPAASCKFYVLNMYLMGPSIKYVRIELGQSTAEVICRSPCGLNPHGPRQIPSALGKKSLETKLEMKY